MWPVNFLLTSYNCAKLRTELLSGPDGITVMDIYRAQSRFRGNKQLEQSNLIFCTLKIKVLIKNSQLSSGSFFE